MKEHDPLLLDDILDDHIELSGDRSALSSTFFPGANRGYLVDLIRFLLEYDAQLLVVTGARGVGKSVLLAEVTNRAPPTWRLCSASAGMLATAPAIYAELLRQMELPVPGEGALTAAAVAERLYKLQRAGNLPVLLLDDVQVLRNEAIEAIMDLAVVPENQAQPPLRIALFGAPALAEQVAGLNHAARVRYLQVPAFDEAQTKEYLAFRRNDALENVERVLSGTELSELMAETDGIPARINQWMNRGGTVKLAEAPRSSGRILAWLSAVALVVLVGVGVAFQDRIVEVASPLLSGQGPLSRSPEGLAELPPAESKPLAQVQIGVESSPETAPAATGGSDDAAAVTGEEAMAPPATPAALDTGVTEPESAKSDVAAVVVPAGGEVAEQPSVAPTPAAQPPERATLAATATPAVSRESVAAVQETPSAPPSPLPEPTATVKPVDDGIRREAWIQAQHEDAYTLRIMSVRNEAALQEYIKDNNLLDQVAYYTAWRSTGAWYVLVYGVYPTEAKAMEAMREVEARLGLKKTYPGQFKELHADIQKTLDHSRP
ncbi:MAG: AAA family ATPase [Pseudomonadota bacterium]